jgi:hypothetical protein
MSGWLDEYEMNEFRYVMNVRRQGGIILQYGKGTRGGDAG